MSYALMFAAAALGAFFGTAAALALSGKHKNAGRADGEKDRETAEKTKADADLERQMLNVLRYNGTKAGQKARGE